MSTLISHTELLSNCPDTKIAALETDLKVKEEQYENNEYLEARNELTQLDASIIMLETDLKNSQLEYSSLKSIIEVKSEELKKVSI